VRPGFPNPSMPGEAFMDTPIVNGVAYPYMEVEPRAYRFRILNAGNDRFVNLQLYVAADKTTPTTQVLPAPRRRCATRHPPPFTLSSANVGDCTEVAMRPVMQTDPNQTADTPSGLPFEATAGPNWWQIGTEGGWLAAPSRCPAARRWNTDPTAFNVGVVTSTRSSRNRRAGRRHRRLQGLRRQDAHPLQRRPGGLPGGPSRRMTTSRATPT